MVIDIKMCRFDNVPWGFRLVGGADFEFPLTVVKVTENSIAEEAGLRNGDVIVRINDTATSPLTHDEVNHIIKHCGNVFYLGIFREDEEIVPTCKQFPIIGRTTPDSFLDINSTCKSPISATYSDEQEYLPELPDRPCSVLSENTETKLVEAEIAAVLSGESEVLKEHNNTMGIFPKPGVCMSSDVLRTLNEEAIKTKAEKDKENRKWTTFLQKPNRPIPKSKAQLEAERHAANAYKVKIVKSKPRTEEKTAASTTSVTENATEKPALETETQSELNQEPESTATQVSTVESSELEQKDKSPTPTDSEVPNLEEIPKTDNPAQDTEDILSMDENKDMGQEKDITDLAASNGVRDSEEAVTAVATAAATEQTDSIALSNEENQQETPTLDKTEEELALERQLADVQRQLIALSNLPSTIQSTLDAVTKQLADLLPAFRLQKSQSDENEPRNLQLEQIDERNEDEHKENLETAETMLSESNELIKQSETAQLDNDETTGDAIDNEVETLTAAASDERKQITTPQLTEEQNLKKQKKHQVIEELEEHLDRKNSTKQRSKKRAFGPLTPSSERPVVLPGGRRWYRPKDAYNDEFIAEILSSQAELVTGTTLGSTYESPFLGYDSRVNFMKYQKPEKKIDLNRSEVYKVIHHLDRQPVRGIEVRPPVVPAEADIRRAVQS